MSTNIDGLITYYQAEAHAWPQDPWAQMNVMLRMMRWWVNLGFEVQDTLGWTRNALARLDRMEPAKE